MIIGLYEWFKHYDNNSEEVETRSFKYPFMSRVFIALFIVLLTCIIYHFLDLLNDTNPLIDAFSTTVAFVAQILMILRYRESWHYWIAVNFSCIILWLMIGNYCMVVQYVFWMANCFFGIYKWNCK